MGTADHQNSFATSNEKPFECFPSCVWIFATIISIACRFSPVHRLNRTKSATHSAQHEAAMNSCLSNTRPKILNNASPLWFHFSCNDLSNSDRDVPTLESIFQILPECTKTGMYLPNSDGDVPKLESMFPILTGMYRNWNLSSK